MQNTSSTMKEEIYIMCLHDTIDYLKIYEGKDMMVSIVFERLSICLLYTLFSSSTTICIDYSIWRCARRVLFFFQALGSIVNVLSSSVKHIFELKSICEADIASREVQIGIGANQI